MRLSRNKCNISWMHKPWGRQLVLPTATKKTSSRCSVTVNKLPSNKSKTFSLVVGIVRINNFWTGWQQDLSCLAIIRSLEIGSQWVLLRISISSRRVYSTHQSKARKQDGKMIASILPVVSLQHLWPVLLRWPKEIGFIRSNLISINFQDSRSKIPFLQVRAALCLEIFCCRNSAWMSSSDNSSIVMTMTWS